MITPDDPRHATLAGHVAGCRELCCRTAKNRYEAIRTRDVLLRRPPRKIPSIGVQRRIRALMALGWTAQHIADVAGWSRREYVAGLLLRNAVLATTAERVSAVYDELSMKPGPSDEARRRASAKGWAPPLAWTDIDNPAEQPYRADRRRRNVEMRLIDPVVVDRALAGVRVQANQAERAEVARRWTAGGRTLAELERVQNWNVHRDIRRAA
jgi:hypothetical protein